MSGPIAVTGAAGFIGSAVCRALALAGHQVVACDQRPRPEWVTGGIRWINGSVTDAHGLETALEGASSVIHLAFRMDLDADEPLASMETNVLGTTRLLDHALRQGISRVVWASSVMVYGPIGKYPARAVDETDEPMPRTPYGATKLLLEWLGGSFRSKGLETVGLRFTTVFGPGRTRLGAASFCVNLFEAAAQGTPLTVPGGDRRANLLYVDDAVQACLLAATAQAPLAPIYNVGGFESTVSDVGRSIREQVPAARITVLPGGMSPWPTDISTAAAAKDFGYRPQFDCDASVQAYLRALGCAALPSHSQGLR